MEKIPMTRGGHTALEKELKNLKSVERPAVIKAIAEAREHGDLSENAEYDAAKEAQGLLELKINNMEKVMANARVLDASTLDNSSVTVLSKVTIMNTKNKAKLTYQRVSESEANLAQKKISVSSPMGKGLLGEAVGDLATVSTPNGELQFEIVEINL